MLDNSLGQMTMISMLLGVSIGVVLASAQGAVAQAASGCATPSFTAATNYGVGDAPRSVAVGDFNLDGEPDLAVANDETNNVSVLLGDGIGGFGAATNFAAGVDLHSVAVGDFNLDGKPDLAVANAFSNKVSVLLGDGMGGFGAPTGFSAGSTAANPFGVDPRSVAVGDFNLDGKPDVATANTLVNNVAVLLGNGSGGLGAPASFAVGVFPLFVAVGDFNLDGKPDLAAANFNSDNVSVLLGDGSGGFGAAASYAAGDGPRSVAMGDFNLDGKPDLAAANFTSDNVSVLLGNGSGGFGTAVNFGVGGPFSVAVGDFNGDGKPDLATASTDSHTVSVLLGDGSGGFGAATDFGVGDFPASVAVGDFNLDGNPDLATANLNTDNASVLLNTCTSNTAPTASCKNVTASAGASCTANASIDNGSSDPDSGDTITRTQSPAGPYSLGSTTVTLTVTDNHGASGSCSATVTVADATPPLITCPANVVVSLPLNSTATSMPVNYPAPTATDNCSTPTITTSNASGSLFPVGTTTVNVTANDAANDQAACSFTVTVLYNFSGFFQPVDNLPTFNQVKAGAAVPVKFSLGGNHGLNILAAGSPSSQGLACDASATSDDIEETVTAGGSSLSYDPTSGQYKYVWKTQKGWVGTCRQLLVTLDDGSVYKANFKFK